MSNAIVSAEDRRVRLGDFMIEVIALDAQVPLPPGTGGWNYKMGNLWYRGERWWFSAGKHSVIWLP